MTETHFGVEIDAERIAATRYRPVVDGDFYGTRIYLGSRDALAAARRAVQHRLGLTITRPGPTLFLVDPEAPEPEWAAALREAIR